MIDQEMNILLQIVLVFCYIKLNKDKEKLKIWQTTQEVVQYRNKIDDLNIKVEGEVTEEHPKHFTSMHITYEFWGKELPVDKLEKAVSLSDEKYCGVSATLKQGIPVTHSIIVHQV